VQHLRGHARWRPGALPGAAGGAGAV